MNRQYSEQTGLYKRDIPKRRIIATEYVGNLMDIKQIETASAVLYEYAQGKNLVPVFPSGLIVEFEKDTLKTKVFFEIMSDKNDVSVEMLSVGSFLCRQVDLAEKVSLVDTIESVYGKCENEKIIVSNILLDKYQIGTKKSEFQKLSETI